MISLKSFLQNGSSLLTRRQSSILSAALVIAITYGASMVLGIFRDRLIVSYFYSCCRTQLDVYYSAFRLPDMIFQLVVIGALSAAFIPVFSERLNKNQKEAWRLASSLINLLLSFFLILALIIFIGARPFSDLITGESFTPWQIDLMAQMTRVMLLAQIFFLVSNFFSAIVQSHQRFLLPSLSPIAYNLGIILSILLLSSTLGIWAAPVGVLIGAFFHLLIQVPLVFRLGFRYQFVMDWANAGVRKVLRLMLPRTLALAASQVEATVAVYLATSLSPGSQTIYYLAQRLVDLPVRLVGTSVGQAALPLLSQQAESERQEEFKKTLRESLGQILFVALPVTILFLVLRVQLVRFAYGAKSFPWEATIVTGRTLAAAVFSIFSQSGVQLLVRGYYAFHDTTIPFAISLLSVSANILLSLVFIFTFRLGIFGLALALSISNFLNFGLLLLVFNLKKIKFIGLGDLFQWLKMTFASAVAGFCSWGSMRLMDSFVFQTDKVFPLLFLTIISTTIGIVVYLLVAKALHLRELAAIWGIGRKLSRWRKTLFAVEEIIEPHPSPPSV